MARRLLSWARTWTKLVLVILLYFWSGAAYKLVYAQSHDLSRFQQPPLSYYQRHFLIEWLMHQSWIFGPDFRHYIGDGVPLGLLTGMATGSNPQLRLAEFCQRRERELSRLPRDYPRSLFAPSALQDAWLYEQGSSLLGTFGGRDRPERIQAQLRGKGEWSLLGLPGTQRAEELSRRLVDEYPNSPEAPAALLRVAEAERGKGHREESRALYRRIAVEYPHANESELAATALYNQALGEGRLDEARQYRERAMEAAERLGREKFAGRALPARNSLTILGYRVDVGGLDLRLQRIQQARSEADVAGSEVTRLLSLRALDGGVKRDLRDVRLRLDRNRSELWVAGLFESLKLGVPGPPPRPKEYPILGQITLDGRPFRDVAVVLIPEGGGGGPIARLLGQGSGAQYQARTGKDGRFTIAAVPSGAYRYQVIYPSQPSGEPVVPQPFEGEEPARIVLEASSLTVPTLQFVHALKTSTFGAVEARGSTVPLRWQAWPGASRYRVEVGVAPGVVGSEHWDARFPEAKRGEFRRNPVLWSSSTKTPEISCPVLPLCPDQPDEARAAQYQFVVTALDAGGKPLRMSSAPLARFSLANSALAALKAQHPARRGGRRGLSLGRKGRRRRGQ